MSNRIKALVIFVVLLTTSCVYRPDLQQGNLLNIENIDRVQINMTKSQIKYFSDTHNNKAQV